MVGRGLRVGIVGLALVLSAPFLPQPAAQQLQVCYVGDQQGFWDSATDSCVISDPWNLGGGPHDGEIDPTSCHLSQDSCEWVCLIWDSDINAYKWVSIQSYCY